jgi:hypothetical protein
VKANHPQTRHTVLAEWQLTVQQRDWMSANHAVFTSNGGAPATVVDID